MPTRSAGMSGLIEPMEPEVKHKTRRRFEDCSARLLNFACFQNRPFFRSERCCRWFVEAVEAARAKHGFELWAYVIMPTHVHLLILPRENVPPILKSMKQSVANRAINWTKDNRPGGLNQLTDTSPQGKTVHRFWQRGGGYDRNLWTPVVIWKAIDYIHDNPVKAGLCERARDWPWSSAGWYADRRGPLAVDHERIPSKP